MGHLADMESHTLPPLVPRPWEVPVCPLWNACRVCSGKEGLSLRAKGPGMEPRQRHEKGRERV